MLLFSPVSKDPSLSSSSSTLQSVLAHTFPRALLGESSSAHSVSTENMTSTFDRHYVDQHDGLSTSFLVSSLDRDPFHHLCSSIAKRIETYSLSTHQTMAITAMTSFSEEQTNSIDNDNTYFYAEETSRFDDLLSLTTITSNMPREFNTTQLDTSIHSDTNLFQSDTDDVSEVIAPSFSRQYHHHGHHVDTEFHYP